MKRTDEQVRSAVMKIMSKYAYGSEEFYTRLVSFWVKYDLTQEQCDYLNRVKNGIEGWATNSKRFK